MEIEIKAVTPDIRFALIPPQIIGETILPPVAAAPDLLPDSSAAATEQVISTVVRTFSAKHLWWIIPASALLGAGFGIVIYKQRQEKKKRLGG